MIERGAQGGDVLLQWQRSLELARFYVVQQHLGRLAAVRHGTDERRFRGIAYQSDDTRVLVLDVPQRFAVARVVQLDQSVVVAVQEVPLVLRYPIQRGDSVGRGGGERRHGPDRNN